MKRAPDSNPIPVIGGGADRGWLDLHELGTYLPILPVDAERRLRGREEADAAAAIERMAF